MKRRAFTLMEMMVSVVLIVLITLFMYGAIAGSKKTSETLSRHAETENNRTLLYELFYRDLLESVWVKSVSTANKRFSVVQMQTRNTLYGIAVPHVTYYVNTQSLALIRLESASEIVLPIRYDDQYLVHADMLVNNVNDFNLYALSSDGNASNTSQSTQANRAGTDAQNSSQQANGELSGSAEDPKRFLIFLDSEKISSLLLELTI